MTVSCKFTLVFECDFNKNSSKVLRATSRGQQLDQESTHEEDDYENIDLFGNYCSYTTFFHRKKRNE